MLYGYGYGRLSLIGDMNMLQRTKNPITAYNFF
jgi:hypothetical protein